MHYFSGLFLALVLLTGCSKPEVPLQHTLPPACAVFDMKQSVCIDKAELYARLKPYRVIFIGDLHASAAMHKRLADLIAGLGAEGRRISLANEWFTPADDAQLAEYVSGGFDGNFTKAIGWKKKAGYSFDSYRPIYQAVEAAGGALYGINMDKTFQKAVSENNTTAMDAEQQRFYRTLDLNLTAHRDLLSPFFAHCHARVPKESDHTCYERMYRVQVAWDSYMGEQSAALATKVLQSSEDLLIVFAGAMHLAYGVGINARFARLSREPYVTILPVSAGTKRADVGKADYLLFYPDTTPKESLK